VSQDLIKDTTQLVQVMSLAHNIAPAGWQEWLQDDRCVCVGGGGGGRWHWARVQAAHT
jgi:hypothetical protein